MSQIENLLLFFKKFQKKRLVKIRVSFKKNVKVEHKILIKEGRKNILLE